MKTLGVIPARYASTRFPGKPLVDIGGKTMIRRVYEQATQAKLDHVIVATDDKRIADEVDGFGGQVMFTASNHQSGTDRCAEVAAKFNQFDVVVNIQGDEPFISPEQINLICDCFTNDTVQLATLVKKIKSDEELLNPNIPKVVINQLQDALYFSRHPIPYQRGKEIEMWNSGHQYYKHIGIYGYQHKILMAITQLAPSVLEIAENLEQLRWLENGFNIRTRETSLETISIDTPEDLSKITL